MKAFKCDECGEERPEKFPSSNKSLCSSCKRKRYTNFQNEYYKKWYAETGRKRSPHYQDIIILWQKSHPEAIKAMSKVVAAIKKGLLIRPEVCVICGSKGRMNGHHRDYDLPYDVMWICSSCHKKIHLQGLTKEIKQHTI